VKGLSWLKWCSAIAIVVFAIPICIEKSVIALPAPLLTPAPISPLSWDELESLGRQITVKIGGSESIGSGILVAKQGNIYTVLTNNHVLRSGTYQVQTSDRKWQTGTKLQSTVNKAQDSALLQFTSNEQYPVAKLGNSQTLKTGDSIYVMGFPFDSQDADKSGWKSTKGRVLMRSEIALEDGYQLAYTNATVKGMSGGPVLNSSGEVIALHGQGPSIIDVTVRDEQGREFCGGMQQFIGNYSWGIPIDRIFPTTNKASDILKKNSLLEKVDFQSFDRISSFEDLILNAEVTAAKTCEKPSLASESKAITPWLVFGLGNQVIRSVAGIRSR
jgi:S1-C subfamily serine protease